jgi:Tfp pilus assembly protein PilN
LQAAPSGILITQLAVDEVSRSLTITGIYGSFDQVVTYKQQLEKLKWVTNVTAPLNNFTTDSSARFTITVTR